jgi:histidinol-phosphate aminotransferase
MKIEELIRPNIRQLTPYSSARDEYTSTGMIQLDANENPFDTGLNRYPDPYQSELKGKLAKIKGVATKRLVLGNGSDELIDLILRAFCEPGQDNVLGLKPSYGMYKVSCDINNVQYNEVALSENFELQTDLILNQANENTKVLFICSQNNPTGNAFQFGQIEKLLTEFNGIVVLDEAYIDFSDKQSWINALGKHPYLIILQTLSKAYGLASIRLGMAWSSPEIVEVLNKIKPPYNVNGLTQAKAIEVLADIDHINTQISEIVERRKNLAEQLERLNIILKVYPSDANFLLVRVTDAELVYEYLLKEGVVVRNRSSQYNCENCLRISIGTALENELLIEKLKAY